MVAAWIEEMLPEVHHKHIRKAAIAQVEKGLLDGKMLLHMNDAAWTELGVASALLRTRLIAHAKSATTAPQPKAPRLTKGKSTLAIGRHVQEYNMPSRARLRSQPAAQLANLQRPSLCFEVKCRCVVQNLYIKGIESQTFEA